MAYFDQEEKQYMHEQIKSILVLSFSVEKKIDGHGTLSEHVEKFQLTLAKKSKESYRCIMETYEQDLWDTSITNGKYVPSDPKSVIKLTRRADLKNRLLIKQLRDLVAVRQILNHIRNSFGVYVKDLDDKFISDLSRVFE